MNSLLLLGLWGRKVTRSRDMPAFANMRACVRQLAWSHLSRRTILQGQAPVQSLTLSRIPPPGRQGRPCAGLLFPSVGVRGHLRERGSGTASVPALARIRDAIVDDPKGWRRLTSAKVLGGGDSLSGESLQRAAPVIATRCCRHRGPQAQGFLRRLLDSTKRMSCELEFIETFAATCKRFASAGSVPDQVARSGLVGCQ